MGFFFPQCKVQQHKYCFSKDGGQMPCLVPSGPEEWILLKHGRIKSDEHIKDILSYFLISVLLYVVYSG